MGFQGRGFERFGFQGLRFRSFGGFWGYRAALQSCRFWSVLMLLLWDSSITHKTPVESLEIPLQRSWILQNP